MLVFRRATPSSRNRKYNRRNTLPKTNISSLKDKAMTWKETSLTPTLRSRTVRFTPSKTYILNPELEDFLGSDELSISICGDFQVPRVEVFIIGWSSWWSKPPVRFSTKEFLDFKRPAAIYNSAEEISLELLFLILSRVGGRMHHPSILKKHIDKSYLDHFSPNFWGVKSKEDLWKIQIYHLAVDLGLDFGDFWGYLNFSRPQITLENTLETRFPHHRRSFGTRSWVSCGARSSWLATLDAVLPAGGLHPWTNGWMGCWTSYPPWN